MCNKFITITTPSRLYQKKCRICVSPLILMLNSGSLFISCFVLQSKCISFLVGSEIDIFKSFLKWFENYHYVHKSSSNLKENEMKCLTFISREWFLNWDIVMLFLRVDLINSPMQFLLQNGSKTVFGPNYIIIAVKIKYLMRSNLFRSIVFKETYLWVP